MFTIASTPSKSLLHSSFAPKPSSKVVIDPSNFISPFSNLVHFLILEVLVFYGSIIDPTSTSNHQNFLFLFSFVKQMAMFHYLQLSIPLPFFES
jgi:hypothetical protein